MFSYGYLPRGHDQLLSPKMLKLRETCLAKAHERGMAVVAMKVVGAGALGAWSGYMVPDFDKKRLADLPGAAIRHVLKEKRIDLLVIGMRLKAEVDANIKTLAGDTAFAPQDQALLEEFSAKVLETERFKKMRVD
jgi:predicted aldo/keto reductase-like oxidoreductase